MRCLALDLGTSMGWAVVSDRGFENWGEFSIASTDGGRPEKFAILAEELNALISRHQDVDFIIYERPFHRGLPATRLLWGVAGIVEYTAHINELAVLDAVPSTIKKYVTGNGRAQKSEMIETMEHMLDEQGGYDGSGALKTLGEHEADALALGFYAIQNAEVG